jgi:hypothetical protein
MSPHKWLAPKKITDIKRGNITHYLILEGITTIGQGTLLADMEIASLVKPPNVVWMQVWFFDNPKYLTTLVDMRFFRLSLSTMKCNEVPFTHIYEWKRSSPSSISIYYSS